MPRQRRRARHRQGERRSSTRYAPESRRRMGDRARREGDRSERFRRRVVLVADARRGRRRANKGAVQVPDPFLENVLMRASYRVFELLRELRIARGVQRSRGGRHRWDARRRSRRTAATAHEIDLDRGQRRRRRQWPPEVIAVGETQERLLWVVAAGDHARGAAHLQRESSRCRTSRTTRARRSIGRVTAERRYVAAPSRPGRDGRRDRVSDRLDPRRAAVHRGDPPRRPRRGAAGGRRRDALPAGAGAPRRVFARAALPALRLRSCAARRCCRGAAPTPACSRRFRDRASAWRLRSPAIRATDASIRAMPPSTPSSRRCGASSRWARGRSGLPIA